MTRTASILLLCTVLTMISPPTFAFSVAGEGVVETPQQPPQYETLVMKLRPDQVHVDTVPMHAGLPVVTVGIRPGNHLLITMDDEPDLIFACTANFIWNDSGTRYLGAAGHCFLPANKEATHGEGANNYNPAKTHVRACVAACTFGGETGFFEITGTYVELGPVKYARQSNNGDDVGNDFGIVQIPSPAPAVVNNSMAFWRGPLATATSLSLTTRVGLYGNGVVVGEVYPTKARAGHGLSYDNTSGEWEADIPSGGGDSGSGVLTVATNLAGDSAGYHGYAAVGILTHGLATGLGTLAVGTTVWKAIDMASEAGVSLTLDYDTL